MSTLAAPRAGFSEARPREARQAPAEASIFHLVLAYVLLLPMIFLAARGAFSFQSIGDNHPGNLIYGVNAELGQGNALHSAELVSMFGIVAVVLFMTGRPMLQACRKYFPLLILPIWAMCSTLWSANPQRSIAFGTLSLVLTAFGIYLPLRFTPRQQMQLFLLTGLTATLMSYALVVGLPGAGIDYKNASVGFQGIYPSKNICAGITVLLLTPALLYRFSGKLGGAKRLSYILFLTVLVIGTTSRTGWLIYTFLVVVVATLKALRPVRPLERFTVGWFLPSLAILGIGLVYANSAAILGVLGKDPTLSGRTVIWSAVFPVIFERPFLGFGYSSFWSITNPEAYRLALTVGDKSLNNSENGLLELALDLGFVGVGLILFVLYRSTKNALIAYRRDTPDYAIWYMSLLFISLLALVDGDKFLLPTSISTLTLAMAYVGLQREAERTRSSRTTWV